MRKAFNFFVLLFTTCIMTGCWGNIESDHSPEIYSSFFFVNPVFNAAGDSVLSAKDTLTFSENTLDNSLRTDTLSIGDTVVFAATYYTHMKNLISVKIEWDSDRMDLWYTLTDEIKKALDKTKYTDQNTALAETSGLLYFNPGYSRVTFPTYFVAKDKGVLPLKLTVESDSKFSPMQIHLTIPTRIE